MYTPHPQRPWPAMELAARTMSGDPLALVGVLRAAVPEADREVPITRIETIAASIPGSHCALTSLGPSVPGSLDPLIQYRSNHNDQRSRRVRR